MFYIFWILGMLGFIWAIVDQCQRILLCVRILLANLTPFSTTSETLSYKQTTSLVLCFISQKNILKSMSSRSANRFIWVAKIGNFRASSLQKYQYFGRKHWHSEIKQLILNQKVALKKRNYCLFSVESIVCRTICLIYMSPRQPINGKKSAIFWTWCHKAWIKQNIAYLIEDHLWRSTLNLTTRNIFFFFFKRIFTFIVTIANAVSQGK